jgi:hypothetical protein
MDQNKYNFIGPGKTLHQSGDWRDESASNARGRARPLGYQPFFSRTFWPEKSLLASMMASS